MTGCEEQAGKQLQDLHLVRMARSWDGMSHRSDPLFSSCVGLSLLSQMLDQMFFSGYVSHIPTKRKAPAYSMHGSRPPLSKECSPGPYDVPGSMSHRGRKSAPSYTMAGRPRVKVDITPGPGESAPSIQQGSPSETLL